MATQLSQEHFDETLRKLFALVATQEDLKEIRVDLEELKSRVNLLHTSVDAFAADYRKDADERVVINQKVERIKKALVRKGVASEQELAL